MSQPSHSENFDVNWHGMDPSGLGNRGYQRQQDESQFPANPPEVYPLVNRNQVGFPISGKYPYPPE